MRILVIKLGAKGDVVRTIPIVKALRKKYPEAEIVWVTKKQNRDLLDNLDFIHSVKEHSEKLEGEFDLLINFDMDDEATELSDKISAKEKLGFYKEGGFVLSRNLGGEYYLNTLFDDWLKKSNERTYQSMMFELAEIEEEKEFDLPLKEEHLEFGKKFIDERNLSGKKIIGIHMGAGSRWPSKAWHEGEVRDFIKKAKEKEYEIILFGGPNESDRHENFSEDLKKEGILIHRNDFRNTDSEFAALVNICDVMVCSDSFALHVALGLGKPTIGMFFVTSHGEVEDYGLLRKKISPLWEEFFPERQDQYDEDLTRSLKARDILREVEEAIKKDNI